MARGNVRVSITADATGVTRATQSAERDLNRLGATGEKSSKRFKSAMKGLAGTAGVGSVAIAASAATRTFVDFDKSMRNVNSIAQLSEGRLKSLSSQVLELAGKTAQAPVTLSDGLYQLVSSGFDANESMKILASSARAATAGLTTTEVSTKAVAAVLNAYRQPASKAADISDVLFRTVDRGVITFEDLAQNIGDTLPFAASLGVSLREVGAATATMTKQGLSAPETMTRIRNVFVSMLKPGDELKEAYRKLGVESGEALIKQRGFQGALMALVGTTDGSKRAVAELFPNIRSLGGAMALTGRNTKSAQRDLEGFKDASGATTRALSQQSKSVAFQWQELKAQIQVVAIQIGAAVLPIISKIAKAFIFLQDTVRTVFRAIGRFLVDVWTKPKKAFGDLMATLLRGFARFFDAASHIPGVGKKFAGLRDQLSRAASRADRLGEAIREIPPRKEINVLAKIAIKALATGTAKPTFDITEGPGGDPKTAIEKAIAAGTRPVLQKWLNANAAQQLMSQMPGVGGVGTTRRGTLGIAGRVARMFGLRITSSYRSPQHNAAVGGVPNSLHTHGSPSNPGAIDLVGTAANMYRASAWARSNLSLQENLVHDAGSGLHLHLGFFQKGGKVAGMGRGDKVPAMLEPGEFVVSRKGVAAAGVPALEAINKGPKSQWGQGISPKELPSFMRAIWGHAKGMMGAKGSVPRFMRGRMFAKGSYAETWPGAVHLSKGMARDLSRPGSPGHSYALATLFHELAHTQQDKGLSGREAEGGAELWGLWAAQQILPKLGIGYFSEGARGAYPGSKAWVRKNKGEGWWKRLQFRGFASGGLVARAAYSAGFRGQWLQRMVAEAKGESGWNERAVGDGGASKGLWQIHLPSHPWARGLNLFDPFVNAQAAMRIFRSQGVGAWHAPHAQHMGAAAAAIRSMGGGGGKAKPRVPITDAKGRKVGEFGPPSGGFGKDRGFGSGPFGPRQIRNIGVEKGVPGGGEAIDDAAAQRAEELAELIRQQIEATREHTAQMKVNEYLINTQAPQMMAVFLNYMSQGMGRTVALGRRTPAAAGRVAAL